MQKSSIGNTIRFTKRIAEMWLEAESHMKWDAQNQRLQERCNSLRPMFAKSKSKKLHSFIIVKSLYSDKTTFLTNIPQYLEEAQWALRTKGNGVLIWSNNTALPIASFRTEAKATETWRNYWAGTLL